VTENRSLLSPKSFAEAIGVSESSVKRWADSGLIDVTKTAGGHRRIVLSDAIRFLRARGMRLVHPERIGLTGITDVDFLPSGKSPDESKIIDALRAGRASAITSILTAAFVQGLSVADLWDGPITRALESLGELWLTDDSGIPLEHEGTMAIMDAIVTIKGLIPEPAPDSRVGMGGAPSGDPYLLPSLAASAVLTESGFKVVNLGPDTPSDSFLDAARRQRPDIVWLSLTSKRTDKQMLEIDALIDELRQSVSQVVLGGRFAQSQRLRWKGNARVLQTMNDLALVADTLNAGR
jgi:methanogenic corrinoid protein MtbC1